MGIDLLDLVFRLERTFGVKVNRSDLMKMAWTNDPADIMAGSLFEYVRTKARLTGVSVLDDETDADLMWPLFQNAVSGALGVDEEKVTKESWLVRDLGMD